MARRLGWGLAGLLALLLFVRVFLVGLYYVDTGSMEPTVHGAQGDGEYLAVRYSGAQGLTRFDLVALRPGGGETESRVKRLGGLPGESVRVRNGDLWIDGAQLPPDVPRPALIPLFDDRWLDIESSFRFTAAWSREGDELQLAGEEVEPGSGHGLLYMRQVLKDSYFDASGVLVPGAQVVNDAALELELSLGTPPATVRLGLSEQGDVFELRLEPRGAKVGLELLRRNADGEVTLGEAEWGWPEGYHALRLLNRDDVLRFSIDGRVVIEVGYGGNAFLPSDHAKRGFSAPTDRIFFGGQAGRARFRRVRVLRDLHYLPRGEFAVEDELQLGPSEIFVLGDNSRESRDGRDWGPTPLREVLGRPLGVVWPPSRARSLGRAQSQ